MSPAVPRPKNGARVLRQYFADERAQHHRLELGFGLAEPVRAGRNFGQTRRGVGRIS
jgi:hypothetical protein